MPNVTIDPIAPWPVVAAAAALILMLTLWAYRERLRGTTGVGRWFALGLRVAAILLCVLAALRPSILLQTKIKQTASLAILTDASTSMTLTDEVGGRSRFEAARKAEASAKDAAKTLAGVKVDNYWFDDALRDPKAAPDYVPAGASTAVGTALRETVQRLQGTKVLAVVLLADGSSNAGPPALAAAEKLRALQIPVIAVGFGSESAGSGSRDLAVRDLSNPSTVFVKNELLLGGTLKVRGYPNQPIEVELFAEGPDGRDVRVASKTIKVAEGVETYILKDLKWVPTDARETRLTLKVLPKEGEIVKSNNEMTTYVNVKKGGLSALYIAGPNFTWEYKYLTKALDAAKEIKVDFVSLRVPASGDKGQLPDDVFAPGKYDVYILGDLSAEYLSKFQQHLLAQAVRGGAGVMMLGGRSSFGDGGWANTEVGAILPTTVHPGDGQLEPAEGLKFVPVETGTDSFILKLAPTPAESAAAWRALRPLNGANLLGDPKPGAKLLARSPDGKPLMLGDEVGRGRSLAFAGETWPWFRDTDASRAAHRKFWRQAILWMSHKEDQGENTVRIALDKRRVAVGGKVELAITARDAKNEPILDATYETSVERLGPGGKPEPVPTYNQGVEARGTYFAAGLPGEYKVTVKATKGGQAIGSDTSRFMAYQDDRELENPAADLLLLRQIAALTGGKFLPPEQLAKYIRGLDASAVTDSTTQKEQRIWDNWPFFLIFTTLLSLEWWLRKRIGWV